EVTSGLDTVARHDVRALLMEFKSQGKTVFFSSHELTEVALLCDRIVLLDEGKVVEETPLKHILAASTSIAVHARLGGPPGNLPGNVLIRSAGGDEQVYAVESWEAAQALQDDLKARGATILDVHEEPPSLEDYFVRRLGHKIT
ncbi:MAG TPA: hypothetical protein PLD73_12990, partial [Candidatus Hydrogenedentes bacterium]|nr:hypothetical protein [Candidatus Hydrogenedentota bacterium]